MSVLADDTGFDPEELLSVLAAEAAFVTDAIGEPTAGGFLSSITTVSNGTVLPAAFAAVSNGTPSLSALAKNDAVTAFAAATAAAVPGGSFDGSWIRVIFAAAAAAGGGFFKDVGRVSRGVSGVLRLSPLSLLCTGGIFDFVTEETEC